MLARLISILQLKVKFIWEIILDQSLLSLGWSLIKFRKDFKEQKITGQSTRDWLFIILKMRYRSIQKIR